MIVRALDSNNDWTFGKGKNDYLSRNAAIGQNIQTRLSSFLGDCFFDTTAGIDWFNLLGSKNLVALNLAISAVIINTENVTGIVELSTDLDKNRKLTIVYEVTTVYTGLLATNETVGSTVDFLLTEDGFVLETESGNPLVTD